MRAVFLLFLLQVSATTDAVKLYDEFNFKALASDRSARRAGDLLTVLVLETSDAESSTDLASSKNLSTEVQAAYNSERIDLSFGLGGKGKSAAKTRRNGKIKAALSVRVTRVLTNNQFAVMGMQQILINGEQQMIQLSGLVRQEDISPQNTVLSTHLAQAKIAYSGVGAVSNSERHNYLYKALSFLGLV